MTFKTFEEKDLRILYQAFLSAFSTYQIPFRLEFDAFRIRILNKLNITPKLSLLAMENELCIGFILHTIGSYESKKTIYNGGTGVIPDRRGNRLTQRMYEALLPELTNDDADRLILEVIATNKAAIHTYESLGFQYKQTYKCFKRHEKHKYNRYEQPPELKIKKVRKPRITDYKTAEDIHASFIDQPSQLLHNMRHEVVLEAFWENIWAGYCVFQPHLGRISLLAVQNEYRHKGIGRSLIQQAVTLSAKKELTVINVQETYDPLQEFLIKVGFSHQVDQYEMELLF